MGGVPGVNMSVDRNRALSATPPAPSLAASRPSEAVVTTVTDPPYTTSPALIERARTTSRPRNAENASDHGPSTTSVSAPRPQ